MEEFTLKSLIPCLEIDSFIKTFYFINRFIHETVKCQNISDMASGGG